MGTSLRIMLYNYYKNIYSNTDIFISEYYNNLNLSSEDDLKKICCINNDFKVLLCHCSYNKKNITDMFSKNCYSITCIRDPIKRFISHYYYFIKPQTKKNIQENTIDELEKVILLHSNNLLNFRLSGETENIEDSFNNINLINCILIQEQIDTDIEYFNSILQQKYNQSNKLQIEKINTRIEDYNEDLDFVFIKNNFIEKFNKDYLTQLKIKIFVIELKYKYIYEYRNFRR